MQDTSSGAIVWQTIQAKKLVVMLEVAARQTNDNRETGSDTLEHVSVLYKYSAHNENVV